MSGFGYCYRSKEKNKIFLFLQSKAVSLFRFIVQLTVFIVSQQRPAHLLKLDTKTRFFCRIFHPALYLYL